MALTSARDILNKKILGTGGGVPSADEIPIDIEGLSATKLSVGLEEIVLDINQLSSSVLTIGEKVEKVENVGTYSEEETIIGSYLGVPLYRKVVTFSESFQINMNSWDSTHFTFEAMGLTGLNRILSMRVNTNGATDDAFYAVYCGPDLTNNKISVYNNLGNAITVKKTIIEYTKSATESKKKTTKKK